MKINIGIITLIVFSVVSILAYFKITHKNIENKIIEKKTTDNSYVSNTCMNRAQRPRAAIPEVETLESCILDGCVELSDVNYPVKDLDLKTQNLLNKALDIEYKKLSTYESQIKKYGNIRPFIMLVRSEEQQIIELKSLFDKYGILIPQNPYASRIKPSENVPAACALGKELESNSANTYRAEFMPEVANYPDITKVFSKIFSSNVGRHKKAFEYCL